MNLAPIILRFYCIAAVLLLAWYGWFVMNQVGQLRDEIASAAAQMDELSVQRNKAEDTYNSLESKQRRERRDYTGEQAVLASTAVMAAKKDYERLNSELEVIQAEHAGKLAEASALQLRIVPILAIALLHIFGFFMIRFERRE